MKYLPRAGGLSGRSKEPADTSSIRILKLHPRFGTVWMATGSNQDSGNHGVAQRGPMHHSNETEHWPLGQHAEPGGSWELDLCDGWVVRPCTEKTERGAAAGN
jgi:hypothetical protein